MKIVLFLILPFSLFASQILSYNVYDRTDRTDIMITFDTPFQGVIKEKSTPSKIVLTLSDVTIEAPKTKRVSSKYIKKLSIIPLNNSTQIIATIANAHIHFLASKTTDGYGLRLRFLAQKRATKNQTKEESQNPLSMLPTSKGPNISNSYYIVIAIMLIGIIILLYLKKKVTTKQKTTPNKSKKAPWLFESTNITPQKEQQQKENKTNSVTIRFQKAINEDNSVVMLDFGAQSYLVLMGKSNILLDKFTDEKPSSQQEFESILQSRHEELESFLSTTDSAHKENIQGPLQAYKERAATLRYSENQ